MSIDETSNGASRRDLIKRGAAVGAAAWAAPLVLSTPALAQTSPEVPPEPCQFPPVTENWSGVTVPTNGFTPVTAPGPIPGSTWTLYANAVEVVSPSFPGSPPFGGKWVDLLGTGTTAVPAHAGTIGRDFTISCRGVYRLSFGYAQYTSSPSPQSIIVNVNGVQTVASDATEDTIEPFGQNYCLGVGTTQVRISQSVPPSGNIGMGIGAVTLSYVGAC